MEAALAAARVGDQIEHSNAMLGFLIGAAVGLAVGVALLGAVVAAPFTGGLSLCAGVAAVAALGGIVAGVGLGATVGGKLGGLMSSPSGPIMTGAFNVLVNGIPAARGVIDVTACTKHGPAPKRIAQGSQTVAINSMPAARKGDKTECDGTIAAGSPNVTIGAEPGTFLPISPEIPEWMSATAQWMMVIGGAVALGAGLAGAALGGVAAVGAFLGNVALGVVLSQAGKAIGGAVGEAYWGEKGRIAGETLGELAGIPGARNAIRSLRGHPVDVATGELIVEHTDFELPGPLPLIWTRRWNSGSNTMGELGAGWSHPFDMALEPLPREGLVRARLDDGRIAFFPAPKLNEPGLNLAERLVLHRDDDSYRLSNYEGLSWRFQAHPDGLHWLAAVEDACGNRIEIDRDEDGVILEIRDACGRVLEVEVDPQGRILEIYGPDPTHPGELLRLVAYAYDAQGDLVRAVDARGASTTYRLLSHLIVEECRRGGLTFHFRWDDTGLGRRAKVIETWGDDYLYYCRFDYSPDELMTVVTDDRGGETLYRYNRIGLVVLERDPLGHEQRWLWSEAGALLQHTDGAGRSSAWEYDHLNRLVRQTGPDGASIRAGFEALTGPAGLESPSLGLPLFATEPGGGARHFDYDARGQLSRVADPLGRVIRFLRNERGLPLSVKDQLGLRRRYSWTAEGMLAWESDGKDFRRRFDYDALGRISKVRVDGDTTEYERDPNGNVTAITRARDGAQVRLEYDAEDQVVAHRDPRGRVTRWDYAGLPFPVSRTDPAGQTWLYRYSRTLDLLSLTNPKGEHHSFELDAAGRTVREIGFDGRVIDYDWDAGGELVERRDAAGAMRFYRDEAGRVVQTNFDDGTAHKFAWDAAGRMTTATTPHRAVTYAYDAAGQMVMERQDGLEFIHEYDARGRRISTLLPDGRKVDVAYDRGDRFSAVSLDGKLVAQVVRDRAGREIHREAGALTVESDYDAGGFLTHQKAVRGTAATPVIERRYAYDAYGQLAALEDLARGTKLFRYDVNDALIGVEGAVPEAFVADPAGNILPRGVDGPAGQAPGDRLRVWGDRRFDYDAAGRRVRELRGAGEDHEFRYAYDGAGKLAEVTERSRRGGRVTRFGYDALGRRAWKETAHVAPEAANAEDGAAEVPLTFMRTSFFWDGDVLIGETSPRSDGRIGDPLAKLYLHEPGSFRPLALAQRRGPGEAAELHHFQLDAAGTPQELTNDNGEVTWSAELTAWGATARKMETEVENPIRFQGQYADAETGLHYNRFRYYDPGAARYVSPDPIGLGGGTNAFAYAPDPNLFVDPLGLACAFVDSSGKLNLKNKFPAGSAEDAALKQHVSDWNQQIAASGGTMTRQAVTPSMRQAANQAAASARAANPAAYPRGMAAGHTPDVGWGGATAGPINPLHSTVNGYVGGATQAIPVGTTYNGVILY